MIDRLLKHLRTPVDVVAYEYPGYATSRLPASVPGVLLAAEAAWQFAETELGADPTVRRRAMRHIDVFKKNGLAPRRRPDGAARAP